MKFLMWKMKLITIVNLIVTIFVIKLCHSFVHVGLMQIVQLHLLVKIVDKMNNIFNVRTVK